MALFLEKLVENNYTHEELNTADVLMADRNLEYFMVAYRLRMFCIPWSSFVLYNSNIFSCANLCLLPVKIARIRGEDTRRSHGVPSRLSVTLSAFFSLMRRDGKKLISDRTKRNLTPWHTRHDWGYTTELRCASVDGAVIWNGVTKRSEDAPLQLFSYSGRFRL